MASTKSFTREEVAKHNKEGDLWVIIDAKVYDLSKFSRMHPGGLSVLLDEEVAGQDATEIFYSLHRQEVLLKPGYARLQVGVLQGEEPEILPLAPGALSKVPHAEPTWLTRGYYSPYFKDSHRKFQAAMRKFVDEIVYPDGQLREADGKRVSQSVLDAMAAKEIHAMRLGPGKHLKGRVLFDGLVQPEEGGFTVLLIERGEGVETTPIKTSYSPAAGTAFVTFDNVKVPVGNTLGPVDGGLIVMLANFNHERWVMCCSSARAQRLVVEECMKWCAQRKVFGKPLVSQAVVRAKLANMITRVESAQNWLEAVTYQMNNMSYKQQSSNLAGQIGFLKKYCTSTAQDTAREAVQVFGGRGITRTGMGRFIEHYHTTVTFDSLLGGAEDVLGDLGVRQAMRKMPSDARL
ncbi:hypothetical protein FRC01_013209 [Tulasnella sp. 417]|nr:hypothetical protein FRC01_013209 [Tulasnella sp. 417]